MQKVVSEARPFSFIEPAALILDFGHHHVGPLEQPLRELSKWRGVERKVGGHVYRDSKYLSRGGDCRTQLRTHGDAEP